MDYQNIMSAEELKKQSYYRERSRFVEQLDSPMVTDPMATHPLAILQTPEVQRVRQTAEELVHQREKAATATLASRKAQSQAPRRVEIVLRHVKATKYHPTGFTFWETLKQRNGPYVPLEKHCGTYDQLRQVVVQLAIEMYPKLDVEKALARSKAGHKDGCRNRILTVVHGDELPVSRSRWDEDRSEVEAVEAAKVVFEFEAKKKPKDAQCHGLLCRTLTKLTKKLFSPANPATDEFTKALDKKLKKAQTPEEKQEQKQQEKNAAKAEHDEKTPLLSRREKAQEEKDDAAVQAFALPRNAFEIKRTQKAEARACARTAVFEAQRKQEERNGATRIHRALAAKARQEARKREWISTLPDLPASSYLQPFL